MNDIDKPIPEPSNGAPLRRGEKTDDEETTWGIMAAGIFGLAMVVVVVLNALSFVGGVWFAGSDECNSPLLRYETIVPGFRVGCWLQQPLEGASNP